MLSFFGWFKRGKGHKAKHLTDDIANPHYRHETVGNDASARPWEVAADFTHKKSKTAPTTDAQTDKAFVRPDVPSQPSSGLLKTDPRTSLAPESADMEAIDGV